MYIFRILWLIICLIDMQELKRRGVKVVVAGIPKTIDNDIAVGSFDIHVNWILQSTSQSER